jgi:nucleoside-diphosphate-sugar epimerase
MLEPKEPDNYSSLQDEATLVTGGSGLVGAELIRQLLEQGQNVKATYNKTPLPDFGNNNLTSIQCDILDTTQLEVAMKGITRVYHCAAIVSLTKKNIDELYAVNINGTTNIVNACLDAGVKKLVHVSSVSALGKVKGEQLITEEMMWTENNNKSVYGKSKFLSEMEVWRGIGEGLQAVIVNPSVILGVADWNSGSTKIFKTAFEEFPWFSEGVGGFVDVKDVAKAMILLMNSEITNERFILNADNLSYKTIFTEIANRFGKKPPYKKVTPFLASLVWRTEALKSYFTGKEPLLNKETAHKALSKVYFDNTKIKKSLPEFSFRPIDETIKDTCEALQKLNRLN